MTSNRLTAANTLSSYLTARCRRTWRKRQTRQVRRKLLTAAQDRPRNQMAVHPQQASLGPDPAKDPDQPVYHVAPRQGWANDGNGFIYYKGRYHMFYQHIPDSSDWAWRMCWGHASSADLINWEHEPVALRPTPGGPDEKGCWSGCCAIDQHGVPTILYTGVRLGAGPRQQQPQQDAISQPVVEVQCAATADPDDERLREWTKVEQPVIPAPPAGLRVTGFRDPYVIQTGGKDRDWLLLVGSGVHGEGGTLLLYRSRTLTSGWEYVCPLCVGRQTPGEEHDTGAMWECPFFVPLPAHTSSGEISTAVEGEDYIICVSPYPHINKSPTNTCLYWIGRYADGKFDLQHAKGPFPLDLGDSLYAPNCFRDGSGRRLMLGWFQELGARGPSSGFTYSGCLTLPRVLSRRGDRLHQAPAPELLGLRRQDNAWRLKNGAPIFSARATLVPLVSGSALNVDVTIDTAKSDGTAFSVLLVSAAAEQNGAGFVGSVAVTVDWAASTLKVHQLGHIDPVAYTFDVAETASSVGGRARLVAGEPVHLQVFLDHSALEVFLGSGETLCTRVYRRVPPEAVKGAGIALVAHGGTVELSSAEAYEMRTIWSATAGL